jgi:N-acetylglucosaminyldiphosphoundecaprenol N-acetyl-beta-D-mannosaminyltransferase
MNMVTSTFAGIPVSRTTLSSAADELLARARCRSEPMAYRLVNSYTFALADQMRPYHHLLRNHGINLPDGRPLVQSLNTLVQGAGDFQQVRGPSLFAECLDRGRAVGIRHFFLGGTPALLDSLVRQATTLYPGVSICGTHSPPFRELTEAEIVGQDRIIATADPDVVWIGLGTPKQDFEAQRLCDELRVTTAGVGAAFDFIAGTSVRHRFGCADSRWNGAFGC